MAAVLWCAQRRAEELMGAAAPHRERRAALSSALCDSHRAQGNGMELCQGRELGVRDRVCTRGRWVWNGLHRVPGCQSSRSMLDSALRHR